MKLSARNQLKGKVVSINNLYREGEREHPADYEK